MTVRVEGARRPTLPAGIWALGFVSLFMDVSSEMIHALLPVYLVTLGTSALAIGVIEGVAEATASVVKIFSGALSDWFGRRKLLLVLGYGLGALSKPLFPLATSASLVLAARFVDRVGKGARGAPRDALVGDLAPPEVRGAAFGLRQSLDTVGAFSGPLLAIALMAASGGDIHMVFWIAVIPALLAVAVLVVAVREPARPASPATTARSPIHPSELRRLGPTYWRLVTVGTVLTLARFSEAFLILRAQDLGLVATLVPLVLVVMNVVYGLVAYPVGLLADRNDPKMMLCIGFGVLVAADVILAFAPNLWVGVFGVALWGLHMGMTQGLLASLVSAAVPADRRGTAFGVYNLAGGVALLLASVLAGALWQSYGPGSTFMVGAALTMVGLIGAVTLLRRDP